MAWTIWNRGLFEVGNLAVATQDLRLLVLAGASIPAGLTNAASFDLNTVADVLAVSGAVEAAAAGYTRFDLAGIALNEDDTNDYAELVWTDPTWNAVATGETWRAVVLYREVGVDSADIAWGIDVFGAGVPTNGSNITYSGGKLRITR